MSDATQIPTKHRHNVVYFYDYNARIFRVSDPTEYLNLPDVAVDPDMSLVHGLPPHYWKLEGGKVVPKTLEERQIVDEYHAKYVQKNPQVITVTKWQIKEVEKPVEKIVRIEVPIEKKEVVKEVPRWVYLTHALLIGVIFALILHR